MVRHGVPKGWILLLVFAVAVAAIPTLSVASLGESMYVGQKRCGECHSDVRQKWASGPHARATQSLGPRKRDRACLTCHATGAFQGVRLDGVQCEACHGAGRGYSLDDVMRNPKLSRDLGLRDLSQKDARDALCRRCHTASTSLEPFDTEVAWRSIAHP